MNLTDKQITTIMIVSVFTLNIFDSLFLPNTAFSSFKLFANIFILAFLAKLIKNTISDLKSNKKGNITGFIVVFILIGFMFKVINF